MKRLALIIFISAVSFIQVINAQVSIAPIAGVNLANNSVQYYVDDQYYREDHGYKTYYFGGLIAKYDLNEKLSIQLGIQYSDKGYRRYDNNSTHTVDLRHSYLDLLPMLEYKPNSNIGLYGGFNFGIKLYESYRPEGSTWTTYYNYDPITTIDFGALLGMRYYYKSFFVGIHYNRGLIDIAKDPQLLDGPELRIIEKNSTFQIGAGYFFKL